MNNDEIEPYDPPESLWQFIKSVANERELDVIKFQIGECLIEQSIDLHNEIDTLLEIWRDYRNETMINLNQIKHKSTQKLPEPPNIRETLKKEICLFVKQMREQYKNDEEKFRKQIMSNKHNLNVINYVLNTSQTNNENLSHLNTRETSIERPKSSLNNKTGCETPIRTSRSRSRIRYTSHSNRSSSAIHNTPISSNLNRNTSFDENVELLVDDDKINSLDIDQIVEKLRDLLQQECDQLKLDIDFLYECIDKESEFRLNAKNNLNEPSLNELKEERKRLESDLLTTTGKNQVKISKLPTNVSATNSNRSIRSPIMTNRLTSSPPSSASSNRSHQSVTRTPTTSTNIVNNLKPVLNPKRSTSLSKVSTNIKNEPNLIKKQFDKNSQSVLNSTGSSNTDLKPISSSRTNSAASSIDSVSISSHSAKTSAVQKFRQMVLESRD